MKVLVPTDMSDFGKIALLYAERFREKLGASVTVLFVNEPVYPLLVDLPAPYDILNSTEVHQRFEKMLIEYVNESVAEGDSFETRIIEGVPARAIVETAEEIGADLIIMGTHGRSGLKRALLGSVTENVLRKTLCPVLTVTPPAAAARRVMSAPSRGRGEGVVEAIARNRPVIETILCPVNFTPVAHDALVEAGRLAEAFSAELLVMHVAEDEPSKYTRDEFMKWIPESIGKRVRFRQLWTYGKAADRVFEVADEIDADLIVLGAQHRWFRDTTVMGQTTERVTRFARQPVLTVVRKAETEEARASGAA